MSWQKWGWMVALATVLSAAPAWAQNASEQSSEDDEKWEEAGEHEWSAGISQARRDHARVFFRRGNALLKESLFPAAAEAYDAALLYWNHPNIHFNLALALINLDRPLEVREHLVAAMRYGPWPLKPQRFEHAKKYMALLEQHLAHVAVRCDVAGAAVTMDGEELLAPPGVTERWTKPGYHVIAATKAGFVANQVERMFEPGSKTTLDLRLGTQEELTQYRRRWSEGVPWAFLAPGAVVALVGGGLYYAAVMKLREANDGVHDQCANGCHSVPAEDSLKRAQSVRLRNVAVGGLAVGGAALLTGGVLAYMNRAEAYVEKYRPDVTPEPSPELSIAPLIDKDVRGIAAAGRF